MAFVICGTEHAAPFHAAFPRRPAGELTTRLYNRRHSDGEVKWGEAMCGVLRFLSLAICCATVVLTGCAPDAWSSYKATGFNEYLNTVQGKCQPLWIGNMYLQQFDAASAPGQGGNFDMLLDLTSRLYYNRMTPSAFRSAVQSQFLAMDDPRTSRSIDCMIALLPTDRPAGPPGRVLSY